MSKRGFALSVDALLSLAIVAVALGAIAITSVNAPENLYATHNDELAHDYLLAKYAWNAGATPEGFAFLTGKQVSETRPYGNGNWMHATALVYPSIGGCPVPTSCVIDNQSASILSKPDLGVGQLKHEAWVSG